jgi:hypothetical protein
VSVNDEDGPANGRSEYVAITANARYVGFQSYASNLVPGDTNGRADAFVFGPLRP